MKKVIVVILVLLLALSAFGKEKKEKTIDFAQEYQGIDIPVFYIYADADSNTYALNSFIAENIEAIMEEYFIAMDLKVIDKNMLKLKGLKEADLYDYLYDHNIKMIVKINADTESSINNGFSFGKGILGALTDHFLGGLWRTAGKVVIDETNFQNTVSNITFKFIDVRSGEVFYSTSIKKKNMYGDVLGLFKKSSKEQTYGTIKGSFKDFFDKNGIEMKKALYDKWKELYDINVFKLNVNNVIYKDIEVLLNEIKENDEKIIFCENQNYTAGTVTYYIETKSDVEQFMSGLEDIEVNGKTLSPDEVKDNNFFVDLN